MTANRNMLWAGLVLLAVLLLGRTFFFVVDQRENVIVLRFGQFERLLNAPGLGLKLPWEQIIAFDKRNQALDADKEEVIAADQERLVVDAFMRYRITDPLQYYRTLGDDSTAHDRLDRMVNSALREVLGAASSTDIISGRRSELMLQARNEVATQAKASRLGIQILDLRIKRADLPPANEAAVFQRMKTARQQEAAQIRAVGEQNRREIMADADKQVAITLATANEQSAKTRGEGEAKRAILFAQSFGRDPSFATFYRSLQAYETALGQGDTTMVLSPDSAFFKYFQKGPGR
jgi:modulator of FtsH protease HflC